VSIADVPKDQLRRSIAIVLQDTVLFSDSIRANIKYGRLEADDEAMKEAAATANADVFIERLPEGYDTILAESGSNLSQGQRQLLSIARAVLADPKILILDEATSSVDTRTEMRIQQAMVNLMKNRTSLIIAHRLSTIRDADVIVVLRDGVIAEAGDHETLLAAGGEYAKLYSNQFAGMVT
jgi:ATP-binding cassette subfamily B protein